MHVTQLFAQFDASTTKDIHEFFQTDFVQALATIAAFSAIHLVIRSAIGRLVHRALSRHRYQTPEERDKRETTLTGVFHGVSGVALWFIAALMILTEFHVNLGGLLTGAGLFSVIIGFGAQNIIKDLLAGMFIILENQYGVGDIVILNAGNGANISGTVEDVGLRNTKLRDLDGNVHYINNGNTSTITNSSSKFANVNLNIRVSYNANIEEVAKVINKIGIDLAGDSVWGKDIFEAIQFMRVDDFEEFAVSIKMIGKVRPGRQYDVAGEFRRRLLDAFKNHRIDVPLAQVVRGTGNSRSAKAA